MIYNVSEQASLLHQYLREIRDVKVQNDRMRFRTNLERIGEIMAYELSKHLEWVEEEIQTPLSKTKALRLADQPVIGSVLRAGLGLHYGILRYFDQSDNAFISAYRKHDGHGKFHVALEYWSAPVLDDRILIIADPMMATGTSMFLTLQKLMEVGSPREIHVLIAIASQPGVDYLMEKFPFLNLWVAAIDPELNSNAYIIPGLGDAGDLAFGNKISR